MERSGNIGGDNASKGGGDARELEFGGNGGVFVQPEGVSVGKGLFDWAGNDGVVREVKEVVDIPIDFRDVEGD